MIGAVLEGLMQGKALGLARLAGELNALGVSVGDRSDIRKPERTMALTSSPRENDRIASIVVQHNGISIDGRMSLYAQSWINGVYVAYGKRKKNYLFPWPFMHSYEEVAV